MSPSASRYSIFAAALLICATASTASIAAAPADAPCAKALVGALKIAGAAPNVCVTSSRLVSGRDVVLAAWDTDPDSPAEIPLAAILDRKALEQGRKEFLYKRKAMGENLQPFMFNGKTVSIAIGDFDGSGRMGFGMWVIPDADYFFAVTTYDPAKKSWKENGLTATDIDAMVEVSKGQIRIPICDTAGGTPAHPSADLFFNVYRLKNGKYEADDKRILATAAPAAERDKCRKQAQ